MLNKLIEKLDTKLKRVAFGFFCMILIFIIGLPTYGDFLLEFESRWTGESLINWEAIKSFCGWEARRPGEEESWFRIRSFASAVSAKVGASFLSFALLGVLYLAFKLILWTPVSKKNSLDEPTDSSQ
ncbi:MAG: hypothetical protein GY786_08870 [Proteobacteria bacterium]|nr:hypothetical protein [Pseudomonadota bacterium]